MPSPTLRLTKGAPLTHAELDANFAESSTDTSTTLAGSIDTVPAHRRSILTAAPATESQAVFFGAMAKAKYAGPGNLTGQGHIVGSIGVVDVRDTVAGAYGLEGRLDMLGGALTFGAGCTIAANTVTDGATGSVTVWADYYSPLFSDHSYISVKYSLYNADPDKAIHTLGRITNSRGEIQAADRASIRSGRYYPIEGVNALYASTPTGRNVMWAALFVARERATWTRIGITLGTGVASCVARLGIYSDANGAPGDLVLDAGTINCDTGDVGTREITISQSLDSGVYWLVVQMTGSASDPAITWAGLNGYNLIGMSAPTGNDSCCYAANSGALPGSFGAPTFTGGGFAPFIWLRVV